MFKKLLVVVIGLLALGGCGTSFQTTSDANPLIDFSPYRNFAWAGENPMIEANIETGILSPLLVTRIEDAIVANLTTKGYVRVEDPQLADFLVGFTLGSREVIDVSDFPSARYYEEYYRGPWYGNLGEYVRARSYDEGEIAIDIFDVQTRQPAWHGGSKLEITPALRENPGPTVVAVVEATLEGFPAR